MPTATTTEPDLPAYDPYLRAYHHAFAPELERAVRGFKLPPDPRVLDVPCGDGFYTNLLARGMGPAGRLVACDLSPEYLEQAEATTVDREAGPAIEFVEGDAYHLPFDDASFDLVWCAQSMISLDDPVGALREMRRVAAPGGTVAVLETDEFHHVLLPWPTGLEVALPRATRSASRRKYGSGGKLAPARRLRAAFREAGFSGARKMTVASDRQAPFDAPTRTFLEEHFRYLREFVRADLTVRDAEEFDRLTDPANPEGLLNRADAELTCLAVVFRARG